jgi:hypothetical protein
MFLLVKHCLKYRFDQTWFGQTWFDQTGFVDQNIV